MGPTIIIDKSTLQALSQTEIQFLFKHYYVGIAPVLLIEILGDLKKPVKKGRLSEEEVQMLARKISPLDSTINDHYIALCVQSLLDNSVPMTRYRQLVRSGGQEGVTSEGETFIYFPESPEREALRNWKAGSFSEAERVLADRWRSSTHTIDLEGFKNQYKDVAKALEGQSDLTLVRLRKILEESLLRTQPDVLMMYMNSMMNDFGLPQEIRNRVYSRWLRADLPNFKDFAGYAYFYFLTSMVFNLGVIFGLVTTRPTNRVDLEYIYYLPFCMVFSSGDKLHKDLCSAFLDRDQTFVHKDELKADLRQIADHCDSLTQEEKEEREFQYGCYPPENSDSVTDRLWKKYMLTWQPGSGNRAIRMSPEEHEQLVRKLESMTKTIERREKT